MPRLRPKYRERPTTKTDENAHIIAREPLLPFVKRMAVTRGNTATTHAPSGIDRPLRSSPSRCLATSAPALYRALSSGCRRPRKPWLSLPIFPLHTTTSTRTRTGPRRGNSKARQCYCWLPPLQLPSIFSTPLLFSRQTTWN